MVVQDTLCFGFHVLKGWQEIGVRNYATRPIAANELLTQKPSPVLLLDIVLRETLDQFVSSVDYFGLDQQITSFALESSRPTEEELIDKIVPQVYYDANLLY